MSKNASHSPRCSLSSLSSCFSSFKIPFFGRRPIVNSVLYTIGTDFVIHNTFCYSYANNSVADFVWATSSHAALLWFVENPDSQFRLRQFASAVFHAHRLVSTSLISLADIAASRAVGAVLGHVSSACSRAPQDASQRAFRRLMLTLRRNGGVYADALELLNTFAYTSPSYFRAARSLADDQSSNGGALYKSSFGEGAFEIDGLESDEPNRSLTALLRGQQQLIERELNVDFASTFSFAEAPNVRVCNDAVSFDCILHCRSGKGESEGDVRATVTLQPPHLARMRRFDAAALSLLARVVLPIAFPTRRGRAYGRLLAAAIENRLSWSLTKEAEARTRVLSAFGVNSPSVEIDFINDNENEDFDREKSNSSAGFLRRVGQRLASAFGGKKKKIPIAVAAPIPQLCSPHVMVCVRDDKEEEREGKGKGSKEFEKDETAERITHAIYASDKFVTGRLTAFTSDLYARAGLVVPNLAVSNVRTNASGTALTLERFGSLTAIESSDVAALGTLSAALLVDGGDTALAACRRLGVERKSAQRALGAPQQKERLARVAEALMLRRPELVIAAGETLCGLASHISDTLDGQTRTVRTTADYIGMLLTDYSLKFERIE